MSVNLLVDSVKTFDQKLDTVVKCNVVIIINFVSFWQKIEVDSRTRLCDIHENIVKKLQLKNADEYGLFFGLKDKGNKSYIPLLHIRHCVLKEIIILEGLETSIVYNPVFFFCVR